MLNWVGRSIWLGQRWLGACIATALAACTPAGQRRASTSALGPSVAFYYGTFAAGARAPWQLAARFDLLVVEPDQQVDPRVLGRRGTEPIAYLSVGEIAADSPLAPQLERFRLGENTSWGSLVLDISSAGYQNYLIQRVAGLVDQGYSGIFLDTLDSYRLVYTESSDLMAAHAQLTALIHRMARERPQAQIWLNRGFELLPEVAEVVKGVVVESLFDRFVAAEGAYTKVPAEDRAWLLSRLEEVQELHRLPVVVIDYRPPEQVRAARRTAGRIADLGFVPYVADGHLQTVGVGPEEASFP